MPLGSEWGASAFPLALKHACEGPFSTGVKPMGEILWCCSTSECTDIFLEYFENYRYNKNKNTLN
jgi:hypothetical protein